jgi:glycine/D-amino acid oxidase-like deaminating enzyme
MMQSHEVDTLVLGGGVVGMSIAYGLAKSGERVRLLDEGDDAFRAARGNFGLVWVQGKGLEDLGYARWSMAAAERWPDFAKELEVLTGVDVGLSQIGGLMMCLDDSELATRAARVESLKQLLDVDYPYKVLSPKDLREICPFSGPDVAGAIFSPLDGHVNPLRLLRALVKGFKVFGGELVTGVHVDGIDCRAGVFHVRAGSVEHIAGRVVLAAGLGNRDLAPMVGLNAPVKPLRGQILVSERMQPFLRHPSVYVRQTDEGVVQIGDSHEDVGFDDGISLDKLAGIAQRAVRCFPILANVNVVRSWGALRVMTADGFPIYQASSDCPGAFVVTCHSGITLASMHAGPLVSWIRGAEQPADIRTFKSERFDV